MCFPLDGPEPGESRARPARILIIFRPRINDSGRAGKPIRKRLKRTLFLDGGVKNWGLGRPLLF